MDIDNLNAPEERGKISAVVNMLKNILRACLISEDKPSTIMFGKNKYVKMYGVGLAQIFSRAEPHLQNIINKYVKHGGSVLEVGANIGYFTIYFGKHVGSSGNVYAFEPIPSTYAVLKKNIVLNALTNIDTYNLAASSQPGEIIFRMPKGNHSMASMHWHKNCEDVDEYIVNTVNLDSMFSNKNIDFVKIDVEGAEGDVVAGMEKIISSYKPIIFVECSEIGRQKFWEVMKKYDYRCYDATNDKLEVKSFDVYSHGDFLWLP